MRNCRIAKWSSRFAARKIRGLSLPLFAARCRRSILSSAIGLILGAISSRGLGTMLYNVRAFDVTTFAGVTFALALVALLASYIPALRATRADPMLALGHNA